uniref:Uncharacterized protein n=1 Tax=Fibrocapsa japonica TaxID=94617 RepID=A0A7S2UUP8_9STRA
MENTYKRGSASNILPLKSSALEAAEAASKMAEKLKTSSTDNVTFDNEELQRAIQSLQNCAGSLGDCVDWEALHQLYTASAHLSHKDWGRTERAAEQLANILGNPDEAVFRKTFQRVLEDGNYQGAVDAADKRSLVSKPWVVLVSGLNGIRKTSSIYQPWFQEVLSQALDARYPDEGFTELNKKTDLPDGSNSYFRQLDYMVATVANEDFRDLYAIDDVSLYAQVKDAIFSRYRTIAEMLGILLVKHSKQKGINIMLETSGRDVAMYEYIDHCFPDDQYHKLVVNFCINDISFAEQSVDRRMLKEMEDGKAALDSDTGALSLIKANAGGPYGSAVLKGVEAASKKVWEEVVAGTAGGGEVGKSWYKASLCIDGHATDDWTVRAADSVSSESFKFGPPRS